MRKPLKLPSGACFFALFGLAWAAPLYAAESPSTPYDAFSQATLARAESDVARIRALVEQGTLSRSDLQKAELRLADAQDEALLAVTLYGQTHLENMTPEQGQAMLAAARRRLDRQQTVVSERQSLVSAGILARAEISADQDELQSRQRVLDLAQDRVKLLADLREMADNEQRLIRAAQAGATPSKNVMIRYDGNGLFDLGDLTAISTQFEKQFHRPLPISALGQTLVHQALGLDHRNRVDVALNPDGSDGLWLRNLLERLHVPYLAFRSAVSGAATAPHIHIGTGSTRLHLAQR